MKTAAEYYALRAINIDQLTEACGGTIPQIVADYADAYGQEYDAWCEWRKAQVKTQQALKNLLA